ncbi:MAG TPA: hypothetical protein DEQ02_09650 [Ruminococcaceae bacterium]|nr:hypothetical protein [Oscillospiraceae bacterium]
MCRISVCFFFIVAELENSTGFARIFFAPLGGGVRHMQIFRTTTTKRGEKQAAKTSLFQVR